MIKYTPIMSLDYLEFSNKICGDLREFIEELEEYRKELKNISKYQWDSNIARFSNVYGEEFKFHLSEKSKWNAPERKFIETGIFDLHIWNYQGSLAIWDGVLPNNDRHKIVNDIREICDQYSRGIIQCSDCKKDMDLQENKGHKYFAGIYCQNCWDTKWKEIEAKENYE